MIIYYSGTPGIEGGLPEDLLGFSTNVMISMVEFGRNGIGVSDRRLKKMVGERLEEDKMGKQEK